jgi:PAS domain S-box-containing protein
MHRLLKRQLKKSFGLNIKEFDNLTNSDQLKELIKDDFFEEKFIDFLSSIKSSYENSDLEKSILEHTVSTNSQEMNELNQKIHLENEIKLKEIMEQAPYGFIIFDQAGQIIKVNNFSCELLEFSRNELLNSNENVLLKNTTTYDFNEIKNIILESKEITIEDFITKKDGSKLPVEITAGKFISDQQINILFMFQDITERLENQKVMAMRQREVEELNRILTDRINEEIGKNLQQEQMLIQQSKMATLGDMLGNISHQWRQPLNNLALTIQDLEEAFLFDDLDEVYIKEFITNSMKYIKFMSKTIDDFRDFFRPTKQKKYFFIENAIKDMMFLLAPELKNKNVKLELQNRKNFEILGYENEFKQVVLNLVNNSKDAIFEKKELNSGLIKIEVFQETKKIKNQEYIKILVSDNGGGIPENSIKKIFEPYFTTKGDKKGTGIGLYMSKTIIEKNMNGKLSVFNDSNGAVFEILIPQNIKNNCDNYLIKNDQEFIFLEQK